LEIFVEGVSNHAVPEFATASTTNVSPAVCPEVKTVATVVVEDSALKLTTQFILVLSWVFEQAVANTEGANDRSARARMNFLSLKVAISNST
jgi:hypothetical protein